MVDIKDIFQSEGFHFSISFMFLNLYRVLSTRLKSIRFQYLILFIMYFVFMYLLLTFSITVRAPSKTALDLKPLSFISRGF